MKINEYIYIDGDNINIDSLTKIIYSGSLLEDKPEAIYMHYGYGLLWSNLQEIKLLPSITGYESDINFIQDGDVFFCFRSSSGKWDNNFGQNYVLNVSPKPLPSFTKEISTALIPVPRLKKSYLIKKKIKISFYKIISFVGKLLTGKLIKRNKNSI